MIADNAVAEDMASSTAGLKYRISLEVLNAEVLTSERAGDTVLRIDSSPHSAGVRQDAGTSRLANPQTVLARNECFK